MDFKDANKINMPLYAVLMDKLNGETIVFAIYSSMANAIEHSQFFQDGSAYVKEYDATLIGK